MMTKAKLLRLVATVGMIASALAYVALVQAHLNGERWWQENKLWATLFLHYAFVRTAVGMAALALLSVAAFIFRRRLADRLIVTASCLVMIPLAWIAAEMVLNIRYMHGDWFWDETWRWFAAPVYAQFAVAMLLGFGGIFALTMPHSAAGRKVS